MKCFEVLKSSIHLETEKKTLRRVLDYVDRRDFHSIDNKNSVRVKYHK